MTEINMAHPTDKRPLYTFLVLVTAFATIGYAVAIAMGDDNRAGGVVLVQFAPLVAAFITKFVFVNAGLKLSVVRVFGTKSGLS